MPFGISFSGSKSNTKSSNQQSGTGESGPWRPAQSYLKGTLADTQNLADSGRGTRYYDGSVVPIASQQTGDARGQITNLANQGSPLRGLGNNAIRQGFQALNRDPASEAHLQQLIGGQGGPTSAFERFRNIDQDDTLGRIQQLNNEELQSGLASQFNASGRYGGPGHQQTLGRELGRANLQTQLSLQDRALQAAGGIDAAEQANAQRRLQGVQTRSNIENARAQGLGALAGRASSQADSRFNDALRLREVGSDLDQEQGARQREEKARYDFEQQAPYNIQSWLANQQRGIGGLGQTSQFQNQGSSESTTRSRSFTASAGAKNPLAGLTQEPVAGGYQPGYAQQLFGQNQGGVPSNAFNGGFTGGVPQGGYGGFNGGAQSQYGGFNGFGQSPYSLPFNNQPPNPYSYNPGGR